MATITHKSPRASLQLTHELRGYIWRMRSCAPTENNEEQHQHQAHSTEPEHESPTHPQARGLLTRARIRAPFDGEKISLITRKSNTIDNVKTKIDNVKAKIRDEVD
jgi:hypothetical protein